MSDDLQAQAAATIPVTILTGFLGAGKTTMLNHLLEQPELKDAAVLINEYGDVAIDHLLVRQLSENVVLLDSGCLCCTVRGDLVDAMRELFVKRVRGEVPEFQRIVIETTGLADPAPIIHTLMTDPLIAARYRLDGIVCAVDCLNGFTSLDTNKESVKQAAMADRLVLTKLDLADPVQVELLRARLAELNPGALLVPAAQGRVPPAEILDCGLFDGKQHSPDVQRWLNEEAYADEDDHVCGPSCDHSHGFKPKKAKKGHGHAHAPRHDDTVSSFVLTYDEPVAWDGLALALEFLISTRGEHLLRVKGIVNAKGSEVPLIIHGVQHMFHPVVQLPEWPDEDRRTRIVFITRDLPKEAIETLMAHALAEEV
jgi:G3E family GTPase